jgi:hypothetical protein
VASFRAGSESGLDLERIRPYRTDSCSIRATGGSPPSASLEDISRDEKMDILSGQVSGWLSSLETGGNGNFQAVRNSISLGAPSKADMFLPPSTLRKYVFPFHEHPTLSQAVKEVLPKTVAPSRITSSIHDTHSNIPTSGPGATVTSLNSAVLRSGGTGNGETGNSQGNSAPGGVKAECSICGTSTETVFWKRGLNDELIFFCNVCGLYFQLVCFFFFF